MVDTDMIFFVAGKNIYLSADFLARVEWVLSHSFQEHLVYEFNLNNDLR